MEIIYFIFPSLLFSTALEAGVHDVWSDLNGGFLSKLLFQTLRSNDVWPRFSIPFQIWDSMDVKSSFDLKLMNASWIGPAETNIYQKGDFVYLQVFASTRPNQELYIQTCYATSSSDPMEKSRSALILNKGCARSGIEFISRQNGSINLLLDTSMFRFSQVYVHCSVVFSSSLTPDSKSCNFNKNKSSWVELDGKTSVCECCASKCKGPPSYGGPSNELKALLSAGPLIVKAERRDGNRSFDAAASRFGSSTRTSQNVSSNVSSLMEKSWIVTTVLGNLRKEVPSSSFWLSQPVRSDHETTISEDLGTALSVWRPDTWVDSPDLGGEMDIPQQKNTTKPAEVTERYDPSDHVHRETTSDSIRDWKSIIPDRISEVYVADSPRLNDWDLESFRPQEEELRGDVFMNYKWSQPNDRSERKSHVDVLKLRDEGDVLEQNEKEVNGDEFGKYVKKTKLTFRQGSDGFSSLGYEEEERSAGEQEVKKREMQVEMDEGSSKNLEKDLVQTFLDLVRDLRKSR